MSCLNSFVNFGCQIYKLSGNMHVYVLAKKLSTLVKNVVREIMSLNFLREKCQLVYSINDFTEFSHRSPLGGEMSRLRLINSFQLNITYDKCHLRFKCQWNQYGIGLSS